jgi:hypothetical protein
VVNACLAVEQESTPSATSCGYQSDYDLNKNKYDEIFYKREASYSKKFDNKIPLAPVDKQ